MFIFQICSFRDSTINGDNILSFAELFPADKIGSRVEYILFRTEVEHYKRQREAGKTYSWNRYVDELMRDKRLWKKVLYTFRDILMQMDFKPVWQTDEVKKLVSDIPADS